MHSICKTVKKIWYIFEVFLGDHNRIVGLLTNTNTGSLVSSRFCVSSRSLGNFEFVLHWFTD